MINEKIELRIITQTFYLEISLEIAFLKLKNLKNGGNG